MTVLSWLRFTIALWLLRWAFKVAGWLLLLAVLVAAWPVTIVTILGYVAAWGRGWPATRLRRAATATVALTGVYAVADVIRQRRLGQGAALAPVDDWAHGWHPHASILARTFIQVSPVAVPTGLGLAAALWAWRNYAISAGIGGRMASAPVAFDARQWRRQVAAVGGPPESPATEAWPTCSPRPQHPSRVSPPSSPKTSNDQPATPSPR